MGNDKVRYFVRILVAAYLFYLAYQIATGVMSGDAPKGLLAAVFGFIAAGCFFIWQGVHGLAQINKEELQARNELSAERAEEAKEQIRQIETTAAEETGAVVGDTGEAAEETGAAAEAAGTVAEEGRADAEGDPDGTEE